LADRTKTSLCLCLSEGERRNVVRLDLERRGGGWKHDSLFCFFLSVKEMCKPSSRWSAPIFLSDGALLKNPCNRDFAVSLSVMVRLLDFFSRGILSACAKNRGLTSPADAGPTQRNIQFSIRYGIVCLILPLLETTFLLIRSLTVARWVNPFSNGGIPFLSPCGVRGPSPATTE
jgi:hypothetical protein